MSSVIPEQPGDQLSDVRACRKLYDNRNATNPVTGCSSIVNGHELVTVNPIPATPD
ncbi:MAG: hypothetical protein IPJ20_18465 [Flammeovirgaceae bacterium]|nr:hypothetical protein [Flammeovirgaceae bacterium]